MAKCKRILKRLFCLPPLGTMLAALGGYGFVLAVAMLSVENPAIRYASYLASAYALTVTVTALVRLYARRDKIRARITALTPVRKLQAITMVQEYRANVRFRAGISLYRGLFINLLYIVMKLVSGILYHSTWFVALAIYYSLLALMRFLLARQLKARDEAEELRRYRLCGIILLFMNQALAGIVICIVYQNLGFRYPGILIYAMAAYAFYAIISAAVNVVKTRQHKSPILSAAKAINLVAAMVSILSLETAMLAQFGGADDQMLRPVMTGITGAVVCALVIVMAIYMIWQSSKKLKQLRLSSTQA